MNEETSSFVLGRCSTARGQRSPVSLRHFRLFFVSSGRADGYGADDIHFTRLNPGAREEPQNVGCRINSTAGEASPSYFGDEGGRAINL